jgi:hypothetical protein
MPYNQASRTGTKNRRANGVHVSSAPNGLRNEALEHPADAGLTQRLECDPYKVEVGGSNPSARTIPTSRYKFHPPSLSRAVRATIGPNPCHLCGAEFSARDQIKSHMVSQHGFTQVGGQVFQRRMCVMCEKPALYRFGTAGFCRAHRSFAVQARVAIGKSKDAVLGVIERRRVEADRTLRKKFAFHKAATSRHHPKP